MIRESPLHAPLPRAHVEHLRELFQPVHGLHRDKPRHRRAVFLPVLPERHRINYEHLYFSNQVPFEPDLKLT
jgi:hypothetical protein